MSGEKNNTGGLSALEIDTIGEIMNISMGAAATAASTLLSSQVGITTPSVNVVPLEEFDIKTMEPAISVEIKYTDGIYGSNFLILRRQDVRQILGMMMQTEMPEDFIIDEMAESALRELMTQMMSSSATVLTCFLGRDIRISPPSTVAIEDLSGYKKEFFPGVKTVMTIQFRLTIENSMESEFISVMDIDFAKDIIDVSLNFDSKGEDSTAVPAPEAAPQAPSPETLEAPQVAIPSTPQEPAAQPPVIPPVAAPIIPPVAPVYPTAAAPAAAPPIATPIQSPEIPIVVKDFEYSDFGVGVSVAPEVPPNMDLVMNVPVVVTVELGRTKRKIKEILEFGQGTIVELDKQAGSQVDVIVNGQLIARGDVVVVDDNFSVRITEILKSRDSLTML